MDKGIVLVCEPFEDAIQEGDKDCSKYLYREAVAPLNAIEQHRTMVSTLKTLGAKVEDIREYLTIKEIQDLHTDVKSNLVFVRDPFIVTNKGIVLGKMKERVRMGEVQLMRQILQRMDQKIVYEVQGDGSFMEGGDYLLHDNTSFIGVGMRTHPLAVRELLQMDAFGTDRVAVIGCPNEDNDMSRIHLDCYLGMVGPKQCLVWDKAVERRGPWERVVYEYVRKGRQYVLDQQHVPLRQYLVDNGYTILEVTDDGQRNYACNVFTLPNEVTIVQDAESMRHVQDGIMVVFNEVHKMYGGVHCATQWLTSKI